MTTIWVEVLEQVGDEWKWVPKSETYDTAKDFAIDENNLNYEICRMGQLMVQYGDLAARMEANLKRKEESVKYVQARVSSAYRSQAETTGAKMSENKLNEKTTIDPQYQQILSELHVLRADALRAKHWWSSIIKKADLLNALTFRQNAELKRMPG